MKYEAQPFRLSGVFSHANQVTASDQHTSPDAVVLSALPRREVTYNRLTSA